MGKKRYGNELHPLYVRWLCTTQRCYNPTSNNYKNYGARGITMAEEFKDFHVYRQYIESLPNYSKKGTVDRIDNNGNYEKGNLRWVSSSIQVANQRFSGKGFNKYIGVSWSTTHNRWVARINFKHKNIYSRVFLTEKEALEARNKFIIANDLPHTVQVWSD